MEIKSVRISKKAVLEMSVGTMVTLVLMMVFLVMGIIFIGNIGGIGKNFITSINAKVNDEINNLFAEEGSKIATYPREREIIMDQGDEGGFGFSIENKGTSDGVFAYSTSVGEIPDECQLTEEQAEDLIILGKTGTETLASGARFDEPIFVKFVIPDTAPVCTVRYKIEVTKDGSPYASASKDLVIK